MDPNRRRPLDYAAPMAGPGRTLAGAIFMAAAVTILNVALWVQYRSTRSALEAELGRRLEDVAVALAAVLDPGQIVAAWAETVSSATGVEATLLLARLREIQEAAALATITLYDQDGRAFLETTTGIASAMVSDPLYQAEVLAALRGSSVHTTLYRSGREYLMSGYAPVPGAQYAVGVEADAKFFTNLQRLRHSLLVVGALSVASLVALGLFHARVQNRLARAEASVQQAETLAAMGRMTAGIAHEIRNPLGIIRATATRLKKVYADPSAPDEKFDYIAEEVDRLSAVLDGYLGFARDAPSRLEPLDLVPLVRHTLQLMQPELEAAKVTVEMELPETCMLRGDVQRLRQVLINLALNAMQAMPEGGTLRLCLAQDATRVLLRVADTGPGIPAALAARVFEPFFTTKAQGSGIGLTIVRRIVEEHAGTVSLDTAPAGGARIELSLPRA